MESDLEAAGSPMAFVLHAFDPEIACTNATGIFEVAAIGDPLPSNGDPVSGVMIETVGLETFAEETNGDPQPSNGDPVSGARIETDDPETYAEATNGDPLPSNDDPAIDEEANAETTSNDGLLVETIRGLDRILLHLCHHQIRILLFLHRGLHDFHEVAVVLVLFLVHLACRHEVRRSSVEPL